MPSVNGFAPSASVTATATTSSAATALSGTGEGVWVTNLGAVTVFAKVGVAATAATVATGSPIPAGTAKLLKIAPDQTHVATITASGSAQVYLERGDGTPFAAQVAAPAGAENAPLLTTDLTQAAISFAASGDNTVVSATASQITRVYRMILNANATTTLTIKDGAGTSLSGAMAMEFRSPLVLNYSERAWYTTSANSAFVINSTDAVQVSGTIWYIKSA